MKALWYGIGMQLPHSWCLQSKEELVHSDLQTPKYSCIFCKNICCYWILFKPNIPLIDTLYCGTSSCISFLQWRQHWEEPCHFVADYWMQGRGERRQDSINAKWCIYCFIGFTSIYPTYPLPFSYSLALFSREEREISLSFPLFVPNWLKLLQNQQTPTIMPHSEIN